MINGEGQGRKSPNCHLLITVERNSKEGVGLPSSNHPIPRLRTFPNEDSHLYFCYVGTEKDHTKTRHVSRKIGSILPELKEKGDDEFNAKWKSRLFSHFVSFSIWTPNWKEREGGRESSCILLLNPRIPFFRHSV